MYNVLTQGTPNPNALKFVVAKDVKSRGKVSFSHPAECLNVPLASRLLGIPHVSQVHFFENVITVNQDGEGDWVALETSIIETIQELLGAHDPDFASTTEPASRDHLSPELKKIEEILDYSVRPGLQADGGDLQILEYKDNTLLVKYEGACGSCPSSQLGTLQGIEGILRNEFDPEIRVEAV